ncbi:unnamed protein product [Spirodela intermedia]|uniref:Uncharacterized protein n=1 Tax=Spirodela intermedia TaxID=51605 RepID=A0A7I8KVY5_SPIIN|nr:unnamed protein product [Spirodela intermedia]
MDNLRDLIANAKFLGRKHVNLRMRPNMASGLDSQPTSKELNDGQTGRDIGWRWCPSFVGEWGEAQEYLDRHHAMSRAHHNHYASTCPSKPEVLIDLSDSAYPLYAYTALHYQPLHGLSYATTTTSSWHSSHITDVERTLAINTRQTTTHIAIHPEARFGLGNGPKIGTIDRLNSRLTDDQDFSSQRSRRCQPALLFQPTDSQGTNGSLNPSVEIEINGTDSVPQLFVGAVLSCATPMMSSASERALAAQTTGGQTAPAHSVLAQTKAEPEQATIAEATLAVAAPSQAQPAEVARSTIVPTKTAQPKGPKAKAPRTQAPTQTKPAQTTPA